MSNKLNSVYAALDSHQYGRAIKLASSLPANNVLGKALLAHAYWKNGQPEMALTTISKSLQWNNIQKQRHDSAARRDDEINDIVNVFNHAPQDKEKEASCWWNQVPQHACPPALADETTVATLGITLEGMKRHDLAFRLYAWAGQTFASIQVYALYKQYDCGLFLLATSTQNDAILSNMSGILIQLSRLEKNKVSSISARAALTNLWIWKFNHKKNDTNNNNPANHRLQVHLMLAESLVKKAMEIDPNLENSLLWIEILQIQEKYQDIIDILPNLSKLSPAKSLQIKAQTFESLQSWAQAQETYRELITNHSSEQWIYWKSLIHSAIQNIGFDEAQTLVMQLVVDEQEKFQSEEANGGNTTTTKAPNSRTLEMVKCYLASVGVNHGQKCYHAVLDSIKSYSTIFAPKVSCAYSDIESLVDLLLQNEPKSLGLDESLFQWTKDFASQQLSSSEKNNNNDEDNLSQTMNRSQLRAYMFSIQLLQRIADGTDKKELALQLPDWKLYVRAWASQFPTEQAQKENQPADGLILLAVNQIISDPSSSSAIAAVPDSDWILAATLLEMAIQKSPYNPQLKIMLMFVYSQLHAYDLCWRIFQDLGVKHIQADSLFYIIVPSLFRGALYSKCLSMGTQIQRFHTATLVDTGKFMCRALNNGIWSKAHEFLSFQRCRLNRSMALLEAKGIILDCAPLAHVQLLSDTTGKNNNNHDSNKIGSSHGVVGLVETDVERATQIISQVHQETGAPNLLTRHRALSRFVNNENNENDDNDDDNISDNCDVSILPPSRLVATHMVTTKEEVVKNARRRILFHGMLVRLAVILQVTKNPKKGKIVKPSAVLLHRCRNLLDFLSQHDSKHQQEEKKQLIGIDDRDTPESIFADLSILLSRAIVLVSSGLSPQNNGDGNGDTLKTREKRATAIIQEAIDGLNDGLGIILALRQRPSDVGQLIPRVLVSSFAIFRMTAQIFAQFGWGKRKQSRTSATALAQLALVWQGMLESIQSSLKCDNNNNDGCCLSREISPPVIMPDVLETSTWKQVCQKVTKSRRDMRDRILLVLDEMTSEFQTFQQTPQK